MRTDTNPLVSVLMTAYNREKYIAEAIESVLASTYTNFELIIIDDGSSDSTVAIAKSYESRDARVRVYVNEHNIGQFQNRNLVANLAKGFFLKYLDSDDLIYPYGLEILVNMMLQYPLAGYGLCTNDQDKDKIFPILLAPKEAYEREFCKKIPLFHRAPLSSIIRKDVFDKAGGFSNLSGEGDFEMWLKLSLDNNVLLMPQGIIWYRVHDDQIDYQRRNDPYLGLKYFLVTLKYLGSDCPLDKEERERTYKETNNLINRFIVRSFFNYSPKKALQMYKAANYKLSSFIKIFIRTLIA